MPPDVLTFTTLIKVCGAKGQLDISEALYEEMKGLGLEPNARTYAALMRGARMMG